MSADGHPLYAGVELGGTKCICILAAGPDAILELQEIPTKDPQTTLAAIAAILSTWYGKHHFRALGIASFGPAELDPARPEYGHILATSKPLWSGANVAGTLAHGIPTPVHFDTDVNGAALAEGFWGAARGLNDYAYITVGTGIGVGLIAGGRPVVGFTHGELGHIRVARYANDAWPGACRFHGACVEGLASGPAIEARIGAPAASLAPDDPIWDTVADAITQLLHTLVLATAPRRLILGGGVMNAQPHLLSRIATLLPLSLNHYGLTGRIQSELSPYVVAPSLQKLAGPLGAIAVALAAQT